ncbi:cobaltochelatase CobN [methanogenic archaeon mixed culture ISO4-G1]|nr:cobaltochelatase CobN [methanogenic archaeon mixed culture ISO4-G1]
MLTLATNNQILMMESSVSRFDDVDFHFINLARSQLSVVELFLRNNDKPDIILIMLPLIGEMAEMSRILSLSPDSKVISVGKDPRIWVLNNVDKDVSLKTYEYISNSGQENYDRVLEFILNRLCSKDIPVREPVIVPMHGLVNLNKPGIVFNNLESYKEDYCWDDSKPSVAFPITREAWVSDNYGMRGYLFKALENAGMNVVSVMSKPKDDPNLNAWGQTTCLYRLLTDEGVSKVDCFIANSYMQFDVMDGPMSIMSEKELVQKMRIPIFCPMELRNMTEDEWKECSSIGGLTPTRITIPEIKGFIEPIPIAVVGDYSPQADYMPIKDRCDRLAGRIHRRIMLRYKPNSEKKAVIMLNIGPCSTVEATLGLAHGLAAMESAARMLRSLKDEGYDVIVPSSGDELRQMIIDRRAYPEFRWTSVGDTVSKGGVLYRMSKDEYRGFFESLDDSVQEDMIRVWGEPPGEGMLYEDDIIIAGIQLGNATIMVQPKRGCVGRECSGKYCKILTDPNCPPNHHYLASYFYLNRILDADIVFGMGSHGSMEHLPGKINGLGPTCYPDICIGDMVSLYLFDACDGVHATIAKRRGYATILSHCPSRVESMEPIPELMELSNVVGSFDPENKDAAYIREYTKQLTAAIQKTDLVLDKGEYEPLSKYVGRVRRQLESVVSTFIETDAHVYGDVPSDEEIRDTLYLLMVNEHREMEGDTIRKLIDSSLDDPDGIGEQFPDLDRGFLDGFVSACRQLSDSMKACHEMESLVSASAGEYTMPGPAGNIFRGKTSIYPTGRNLHSANPELLPTKTSYAIGCDLADRLLESYVEEHGEYPKELALSWMSNDLVIADGEMIGQVMSLIGTEPIWSVDGKINDFRIIPAGELKHPRIDVLIRPAGTIVSVFKDRIDLVDRMISEVAMLDEPDDVNYIHSHTAESISAGVSQIEATSRIFGIGPGQSSGLYYAIMASAWEKDSDLAELFLNNNGYAYGVGKNGMEMHGQFGYQLSKVSATFNKIVSDDKDLLLSGGFFTSQGGMAMASEYLTGKKVKSYYGDTRNSSNTSVRTLSDEISRLSTAKILNPQWIESNIEQGYDGGTAMMRAVQRLYGWQITSKDVDDRIFDGITRKYVMDERVRDFLKENTQFAMEDLERRLLELEGRGLWKPDPEILEALKQDYLDIEGMMEDVTDDPDCQRGEVIVTKMTEEYSIGRDVSRTIEIIRKRMGGETRP